jgi:hypothetical protein
LRIDSRDRSVLTNLDTKTLQRAARGIAKFLGKGLKNGGAGFEEQDACTRGVDGLELVA